jgi:hypothetical protein
MQTCAYCGRRLPWLHRVVGKARYCSKEHARLHLAAMGESVMQALGISALGAETAADPGPGSGREEALPILLATGTGDDLQPASLEPGAATGEAGSPGPGGYASLPARPVPAPSLPEPPPLRFEIEAPGEEQALPPSRPDLPPDKLASPAPFLLNPAAAAPRLRIRPRSLRPKRRVVAPAHRAKPTARWFLAPDVPWRIWPRPVAAAPLHSCLFPFPLPQQPPQDSVHAPEPVVVFSFMDGVDPGRSGGAGSPPRPAQPSQSPRTRGAAQPAQWFFSAEPVLRYPGLTLKTLRAPSRVLSPGLRPAASAAPRLELRLLAAPAPDLWDQQAAAVQPFRLHRMPLRPLRLRPFQTAAAAQPGSLPTLGRLSLLNTLHLPKPAAMPIRPVYRWAPAASAPGGSVQGGSLPPSPARVLGG